ncbi:molybdate ABC transporter permease subunit [Ruminiclostridium papyrosolvens]|uniref:Molybdenum transport system permease n=1 Tax=Ruminiclostridium papyrosolvens C7 TaxID=1330534 RepID=U4R165_9FIRM|nr:molybdate ABC transporter permease subunit [Ruminiclostridium papyrosolvens]EPR11916.1 molybdate ABC transporter permease [Ruminiclostridium papyrosolvens C7]
MDLSPLYISLKVAVIATVITVFTGILCAYYVLKLKRFKGLIDGLFTLPMVLPPTVVGFFLLILFGGNSFIGGVLRQVNISVVFSWTGAVIASSIVSFPLMYRTARGAFEQFDENLVNAARTLGMTEFNIFLRIIVPNVYPGLIAGTVLAFARALGEFGATIMLAGNIPGKTRTMAVAVYTAVQAGDRGQAYKWVLIICAMSFGSMILMNFWNNIQFGKKNREEDF